MYVNESPNTVRRSALCPVRTPAPVAAQPGSACPAGTVRNVMGIVRVASSVRYKRCGRYLSSVPDGRPRLSRNRPICLRWLPGGGVDTGGRRSVGVSSRTSPGARASNGIRATGRGRLGYPVRSAAGSVGSARLVRHVHGCHRILLVI